MAHVPVVLIHGFPFDHQMWRHQVAALAPWQCLAPDLRGAGAASGRIPPAEFSMGSYADDLIAVLDRAQVDRAVVCGLSMGGYIAFELLRRFPERVRAVILCNTKAAADSPDAKRGRDELAARAKSRGASAVAEELLPRLLSPLTREQRPAVVREVQEMIARQPVDGIVGALHALRERPDSTPLLTRIAVPVLVIAGDDDQIAPAEVMLEMSQSIPDAQFAIIPETGHLSPLENPLAVNHHLKRFLARV